MKKIFIVLVTLLFVLTSTTAFAASDNDGIAIIADFLILRPIGIATIVGGTGMFILTLPFSVITGSVGKTADALVVEPVNFTFVRDLGDNH